MFVEIPKGNSFSLRRALPLLTCAIAIALASSPATARDASYQGSLGVDDEIVQIPLRLHGDRTRVVLESQSYMGGMNMQGVMVAPGGFDVVLSVYDSNGDLVAFHDDISESPANLDALLVLDRLPAGDYTITVTEFDNLPPTQIALPFAREGQGNFSANAWGDSTGAFWDYRFQQRTGAFAFDVRGAGCAATPRDGCRQLGAEGSAKLRIDANTGKVRWKWLRGEAASLGELGDPQLTNDHNLCVYETVGTESVLSLELDVSAGSKWKAISRGFVYKKKRGNADGVRGIKLIAGAAGETKAKVKAKHAPIMGLPLSDDGPVTAQLTSGEGLCLEATFAPTEVNNVERFEARAD